jgi:arylsulfatase A-like enzyme
LTDHYAIRTENWKYVHDENGRDRMLFDLLRDPLELRNAVRNEPDRAAELRQLLAELLIDKQVDVTKFLEPLDEDERRRLEERLRSLGYIR